MKSILFFTLLFVSSFCSAQNWHTNIDDAKKASTESGKPLFILFEGSDWCGPCKRMEKYIFSTDLFESFAEENLTLLKIDFTRKPKNRPSKEVRDHHNKVAEKYHTTGYFPHMVVLNKKWKIKNQSPYFSGTPEDFIALIKKKL